MNQIETLDDYRADHQERCGGREQELRFATVRCTSPDCSPSAHTHPPKLRDYEHLIVCDAGCGFYYVTDSSD